MIWAVFQIFPRPIIALFGSGETDALHFEYAIRFMRVYLAFVFLNGVQICATTFFPAIGKGTKGAALSFAKLAVFLIPLILILPRFFGLGGVMYATPAADLLPFLMAVVFLADEMKKMPKEDAASVTNG